MIMFRNLYICSLLKVEMYCLCWKNGMEVLNKNCVILVGQVGQRWFQ